ncbi:hypothetical protein ABZ281_25920 [Streptomyces sp. NPDC006265]|uniref:hypothetical protein n=1 Tax=Streptomyces sp. NPDC006265 TaxID=3156740 RepID=UPI00339FF0AA
MARFSFYAWMAGEQTRAARRAADDALAHEITVLHIASRCTYFSRARRLRGPSTAPPASARATSGSS